MLREFCEREGEEIAYRKGDQLEREGDPARWFAFVTEGCFKYVKYGMSDDKAHITWFSYNPQNEMFRKIKTKRSALQNEMFFFRVPSPQRKTPQISLGRFCFHSLYFQTFKSNLTFSSPASSWRVRSWLFSYMCTLPRFNVMLFKGKSICLAIK